MANVPLVDRLLDQLSTVTTSLAVNVHHGRAEMEAHLTGRVHLSVEAERPLGTAGALVRLRDWIAGRPVLTVNGDAWIGGRLDRFVQGWGGEGVRLLVVPDDRPSDFGGWRYAGAALLPGADAGRLREDPPGLYEALWAPRWHEGRLDLAPHDDRFFDCGTLSEYLDANLAASGGQSVVGPGARVEGRVERTVVWPGAVVRRHERLVDAIRPDDRVTVLVRRR